jgi:hypothetical protein
MIRETGIGSLVKKNIDLQRKLESLLADVLSFQRLQGNEKVCFLTKLYLLHLVKMMLLG